MLLRTHLILSLALLTITSSCQKNGKDCIYLIPENFEGNILIIYEQQNGMDATYENKNRVYFFDTTGVLKTKFAPNYGMQKNHYFYVDSLGKRSLIKYVIPSQLRQSDEVVCYNKETGKDFDKKRNVDRHFEIFTIAKEKNIDSIGNKRSLFMWGKLD